MTEFGYSSPSLKLPTCLLLLQVTAGFQPTSEVDDRYYLFGTNGWFNTSVLLTTLQLRNALEMTHFVLQWKYVKRKRSHLDFKKLVKMSTKRKKRYKEMWAHDAYLL